MLIRPCAPDDPAAIYAIQLKCPQSAQWRQEDYLQLALDPLGTVLVAEAEGPTPPQVVGFAVFHRVVDEAELRNIAVEPAHQRKGLARALLAEGIRVLGKAGVRRVFLEVRASNDAALELYAAAGFRLISTRRNYYQDPAEDAQVMARDLSPSQDQPG